MKNLILLALLIGMMGCEQPTEPKVQHEIDICDAPLEEVQVDGCTYLYRKGAHTVIFEHKGNCNNPIHQYNGGSHE